MDDPVKRLQRLDVCAVSDAMDKLGLPPSVSGLTQQSTQQRIAGKVVTYKLVPAAQVPAHTGAPRHLGTTAIEAAQPGDVIVIEQRTGLDAGSWGGILSLAAKLREVAGVVVDGPVRDIDQAIDIGLPIFASWLNESTLR